MKKFLIVLVALFILLFAALAAIPIFFKDDIQQALDQAMDENLNAKVYYDIDQFGLSLFTHFPDITISMGDFGVVGIDEFSEDTLAAVRKFEVTVDLMSAISGEQIIVEEILLVEPKIELLVLADGSANYDITKPSDPEIIEEAVAEESSSESSDINIGIKRWAIEQGQVVYIDQSMDFYATLFDLNHEGSGDFTLDVFDLTTSTMIGSVSTGFEGVEYASNKTFEADVTLNMDLSKMQFTFSENRVAINDFAIEANGFIAMPGEDITMDLTFGGKNIDLKSILSLIPGVYQEYLDGVTASGEINFEGLVKGVFNDSSMPKVAASLSVTEGSMAYAEYDVPIENITIETNFDYPSADLSETSFNVNKFSMLVDGEEFNAYLKFKNLVNYTWDAGFEGNVDLEKITKIVPIEGMTLRGKINAGLNSAGTMAALEAERYTDLPTKGQLNIDQFYFESVDLPQGFGIAAAQITLDPNTIALTQFDASSGNSDFKMSGEVTNYIGFALADELLNGSLSLQSELLDLNEFIPEEEVEEVETVEDTASLSVITIPANIDFVFNSSIDRIAFTDLNIENFKGNVLIRDGSIILDENSFNLLDGTFELSGSYNTKDLDLPTYDFGFKIKDLSIANAFESFGTVQEYVPIAKQVTGNFSTDFTVDGVLGDDMMPIMEEINLAGLVNVAQATLQSGEFVTQLNSLTALKSGANTSSSEKNISLKDVLIKTEIKDGHLYVEPFDLNVNGQRATFGGSNTLEGALDYSMLIRDIPTGVIGNALNSAIGSLTGANNLVSDKININLGIGGTYDDVKVKLLGTTQGDSGNESSVTSAFKEQVSSKVDEEKAKAEAELAAKKAEAEAKAKAEAEAAKASLQAKTKATQDSIKAAADAAKKKAADDAKKKAKSLFKKKKGGE